MKKSELLKAISEAMGISKAEAARRLETVDAIFEVIAGNLETGAKVKMGDYVTVEKKLVPARECRNPKTGEMIQIEEKVAIKVKATAAVKNI